MSRLRHFLGIRGGERGRHPASDEAKNHEKDKESERDDCFQTSMRKKYPFCCCCCCEKKKKTKKVPIDSCVTPPVSSFFDINYRFCCHWFAAVLYRMKKPVSLSSSHLLGERAGAESFGKSSAKLSKELRTFVYGHYITNYESTENERNKLFTYSVRLRYERNILK